MRNLSIEEMDVVAGGCDCGSGGISIGGIGNNSANGNLSGNDVDVNANGNHVGNGNAVASGNHTGLDSVVSTGVGATVKDAVDACLSLI